MSINKGENSALLLKKDRSVAELYKGDTKLFGYNSYAEGETISVDNVHPIEHKMRVGVKSKNLLPCQAASQTLGGVEFTVNEDGSIAVNGTASENILFQVSEITLGKGKYRLSGCPVLANASTNCCLYCLASEANTYCFDTGNGNILVTKLPTTAKVYIRIAPNFKCENLIFYPMLNTGVCKIEYTPYVDMGELAVERYGKNLIDFFDISNQKNIIYTDLSGNLVQKTGYILKKLKAGEKYTISFSFKDESKISTYLFFYKVNSDWVYEKSTDIKRLTTSLGSETNNPYTFTAQEGYNYFIVRGGEYKITQTEIDKFKEFQLELGSSATEYEKYKEEIYAPTAEGIIEDAKSISPVMNLAVNSDGATIDCEFVENR